MGGNKSTLSLSPVLSPQCMGLNMQTGERVFVNENETINWLGRPVKCIKKNGNYNLEPIQQFEPFDDNILQENVCPLFSSNFLYIIIILIIAYFVYTSYFSNNRKLKYV